MKRSLVVLVLVSAIAFLPCRSSAADVGPIFTTPLVGMCAGAMVGYFATFLSQEPSDHYNTYVSVGAGVGFALGLVLGVSEVVNANASFYQRETYRDKLYGFNITFPMR
jgi:hypothetical protein